MKDLKKYMKQLKGWHKGLAFGTFVACLSLFETLYPKLFLFQVGLFGGAFYRMLFARILWEEAYTFFSINIDKFLRPFFLIALWTIIGFLLSHKNKIYRIVGYILIAITVVPTLFMLSFFLYLAITGQRYT